MQPERFDLYTGIHKALRNFMGETLVALGRMDADDDADRGATLAQLRALFDLLDRHAQHEDEFIHPALEARRPGSARAFTAEHAQQHFVLDELRALAGEIDEDDGAPRALLARRLYQRLSLFVAESFAHMHEEETEINAVLWAEYSDAELAGLHDRLVASIDAQEMALAVRWMAPSLTPFERAALFGGLQANAPAEVFHRLLEVARQHLAPREWNKLMFGIAAAPRAA